MKILIVDDHAVVRHGIRQILGEEFHTARFGEARTAAEALQRAGREKWDVVLLDITMPGRSGLEVLRELKLSRPEIPVLILSMHPEDQYAVRVLKAGAAGYMTKDSAPQELIVAVKRLLTGRRYISPSLADRMAGYVVGDRGKSPHERLSDREFQIMRLLASGKTVREIAGEYFLSVKTVRTYRAHIFEKMGFKRNAELTRYALLNRLMD